VAVIMGTVGVLLAMTAAAAASAAPTTTRQQLLAAAPTALRVENLGTAAAVVSEPSPRFSFLHGALPGGATFGVTQASYRITVTSSHQLLWDSGTVASTSCTQIAYNGTALAPYTRYTWTAQWTSSVGALSAPASSSFETGPMSVADWQGAGWLIGRQTRPTKHGQPWPTGRMQLRAEFALPNRPVTFARAFVASTGCAQVEVNGRVPQPNLRGICPWPASRLGTIRYMTHNITALVAAGKNNAVGLLLGNVPAGKQAAPLAAQVLALIVVKFTGSTEPFFLSSGADGWQAAESYVNGGAWSTEVNWARRQPGWSTAGFAAAPDQWVPVNATAATTVALRAIAMPPATVLAEVNPTSVSALPDGAFLYEFPRNFVGTVRLAPLPSAETNSSLTVLLGEWLDAKAPGSSQAPSSRHTPAGPRAYPSISASVDGQQYENHILIRGNTEPLTTLFCYHGFQWVRVESINNTGFSGTIDALVGLEIHTNVTSTGQLSFGGNDGSADVDEATEVLTQLNQMTRNSQLSNLAAYLPTDCPTREKHGWLGDALDASEQALYNFDMAAVYEWFLQLIQDEQAGNGDVPVVVPGPASRDTPRDTPGCNDIAWTAAYPLITYMQHQYYGNTRIVQHLWPSLVMYQENLIAKATATADNVTKLAVCDSFGDWLSGPTGQSTCSPNASSSACPVGAEMASFNYVLSLRAMAQMAGVVGDHNATARYESLAGAATAEFHSFFFNKSVERYGGDIGAVQSLSLPALEIGAPPTPKIRATVVQTLHDDLAQRSNYTLRVGAVTSKILLNVLSENGLHETALRTATSTEEPSWGHWWKAYNATTCYEAFPNNPFPSKQNEPAGIGTLNHIFLCGGLGHWMWKNLAGIAPVAPGFAEVTVMPRIHDTVGPRAVRGEFLSPRGRIVSSWSVTEGGVLLNVSLPVGVQAATIVVPFIMVEGTAVAGVIKEHGIIVWNGTAPVGKHAGIVRTARREDGVAFATSNGEYMFTVQSVKVLPESRAASASVTISNRDPRLDTAGRVVNCHDGNIVGPINGTYFLYGEWYGDGNFVVGNQNELPKLSVYTSPTLASGTWEFRGLLHNNTQPGWDASPHWPFAPDGAWYSPSAVYSTATSRFILYWSASQKECCDAKWGVAQSTDGIHFDLVTMTATASLKNCTDHDDRPINCSLDDSSLLIDSDGVGYVAYTAMYPGPGHAHDHMVAIDRLAPDLLSSSGVTVAILPDYFVEGAMLFKRQDRYYVIYGSCCCACRAGSGAVVSSAANISGPWVRQSRDVNCAANAPVCAGFFKGVGSEMPRGRPSNLTINAQGIGISHLKGVGGTDVSAIGVSASVQCCFWPGL
jgi:alpha-L-rhamnosidase